MAFRDGVALARLKLTGKVGARNTGTRLRFWPDPEYFDNPDFSVNRLKRLLRAKAVLCSGLCIALKDENNSKNSETWEYEDGLEDYLLSEIGDFEIVPAAPFVGHAKTGEQEADWVVSWLANGGRPSRRKLCQSYPHRPRRFARERISRWVDRCGQRIL